MLDTWFDAPVLDFRQTCLSAIAPRPHEDVWQWMERTCSVRGEYEGPYSTDLTPFVREPLNCFGDKRIEDLTLCFAAQIAKTTIVMGGVAYRLVNEPGELLWVMPDKDFGGSFSRQRWQPFVEDCSELAVLRPVGGDRRKFFTTHEQQFGSSVLYFVGSNSPTHLASRSCRTIVMDETDKFGQRTNKEASAVQNAEERANTFNYPLLVKTSTPTTLFGEIWQSFTLGDQRYYYMPCPHCAEAIRFEWPQVKWWEKHEDESRTGNDWDYEKVRKNTFYRCQVNGCKIRDAEKTAMLREGEWRGTVTTSSTKRRSYHLNALYAPWKRARWPELAVQWLESAGSFDRRQKFINSKLAEVWDLERGFDDDPVPAMAYVPADVARDRTPIMTVDVQEDTGHFWVVVRAWSRSGESWLLWAGRRDGDVADLEQLQADYGVENNNVIFDIAHKTNVVCQWLVAHDWRGAWGSDAKSFTHTLETSVRVQRIISMVKGRDPFLGTVKQSELNRPALYVQWAQDAVKDQLALLRFAEQPIWHVHGDAPTEYFSHLNAERKFMVLDHRGRAKSFWKQLRRHNHLNDCECMQVIGAMLAGLIEEDAVKFATRQGMLHLHSGQLV